MRRINGSSRVLVVIGEPVGHSLSPAMHNAAIAALGLNAVYVALPVTTSALPHVMRGFEAAGVSGNVTIPHKVAAASLLVKLTDRAKAVGAINSFWPDGGRLVGDNTDVPGIVDALRDIGASSPWLVAGTGGSARAVAAAAKALGAELLVRSRDDARASTHLNWCRDLGVGAGPDDGSPVGCAINTTPLGMEPDDPFPILLDRIADCPTVLDLVYAPNEPAWCRACRDAGKTVSDGRTVLVAQGAYAFERFFPDAVAPREIMRATVDRMLSC